MSDSVFKAFVTVFRMREDFLHLEIQKIPQPDMSFECKFLNAPSEIKNGVFY